MPKFLEVSDAAAARDALSVQRVAMFDVREFGAACDGVTDDTQAIQNAIDQAAQTAGGVVLLPPANIVITTLRLKKNVHLRGSGWRTQLMQTVTDGHMIILDSANEEFTVISDMRLNGYKNTQSTANDGIHLNNDGGSGFSWYDPIHTIERVAVVNVKGNGVKLASSCRQTQMLHVTAHGADLSGFYIESPDSSFVGLVSGSAGTSGFWVNCSNSRFVNCKSFGSGRLSSTNADGFYVRYGRNSFSGCEAQDNGRHGFLISPTSVQPITLNGCIADSNGQTVAASVGFYIFSTSYVTMRGCLALDRSETPFQDFGLAFSAGVEYCDVDMLAFNTGTPVSTAQYPANSRIVVNGVAFGNSATAIDTNAATSKTTPVDGDSLPLVDSAESNNLKKLTWSNLKATMKTYYDSVTATMSNKTLTAPTINNAAALSVGTTAVTGSTSPLRVSLGGTYGNGALGAATNQKLSLFDSGSSTAGLGIGLASGVSSIEYQVPVNWYHRFIIDGAEKARLSASEFTFLGNPIATKVAVPASAGATGVVGQWAAESGWLYICVATNTWERVAIATW